LVELFKDPATWDEKHRYTVENINVYFEGKNKSSIHKVDIQLTLDQILRNKQYVNNIFCKRKQYRKLIQHNINKNKYFRFIVRGGTPAFLIFIKSSEAEQSFLTSY
jgi:hypothetical protein